jgi:hypothetical protein
MERLLSRFTQPFGESAPAERCVLEDDVGEIGQRDDHATSTTSRPGTARTRRSDTRGIGGAAKKSSGRTLP